MWNKLLVKASLWLRPSRALPSGKTCLTADTEDPRLERARLSSPEAAGPPHSLCSLPPRLHGQTRDPLCACGADWRENPLGWQA